MWAILLFLIIGILIGRFKEFSEKGKKINGYMQQIGVIFLLFFMGASIGANKSVLKNIKTIGRTSLIFAISAIVFSVFVLYFVSEKFLKEGEEE
ncbi:LysO family transporter [Clostridium niameyense]|uniref:LysO family transporter n=1 Tax=Clostridium niameyense TaxID=1622073 RepID=UPI00067ED088|nr:LysO family transporter [Clostridium niameyense]